MFLSLISSLYSQTQGIRFETISVEQGLSQTSVWSILQDHYGFLWFGTADGLNEYDGYTFTVFRHNPEDSTSIPDNNVISLVEDHEGNFWFGSRTGLEKYERSAGTFSRFPVAKNRVGTFLDSLIGHLYVDHTGMVWIGGFSKLGRLNPATGKIETFPRFRQLFEPRNSFRPLFEDSDGDIWIGTNEGFLLYRRQSETFELVEIPELGTSGFGMCGSQDRSGIIWLGTSRSNLISYQKKNNVWRVWRNLPQAITSVNVNSLRDICEDDYGRLWIGTQYSGLFVLNPKTETFNRFTPSEEGKSNIRYEGAINIYRDRSGLLWVGYDGAGIVKINPHPNKFSLLQFPLTSGTGTGDNFFKSIIVDRFGAIWAGTFDKGIKVFNRTTGVLKTLTHNPKDPRSLRSNTVLSLYQAHDGSIWVGTINGIDIYDRTTSSFRHLVTPTFDGQERSVLSVSSICEDSDRTLWFGTAVGLMKVDSSRSELSFVGVRDSSKTEQRLIVERMLPAKDGGLWIGTNGKGLFNIPKGGGTATQYLHDPADNNSLSNNLVKSICIDSGGILWIGTSEGLNRFDPAKREWRHFYQHDGIANDFVYAVLLDRNEQLWMSTNRGLSQMDVHDLVHPMFRNYTPEDGLQSYEFNTGAYFKTEAGEIFFAGVNGINMFFPNSVHDNPCVPQVVFTGFKKFDQPFHLGEEINSLSEISLNYSEAVFSFEFAALEFTSPSSNQYAYRMEGVDPEWIRSGNRHEARYTHLDPGAYVFRVKASNNDDVWNEQGVSMTVHILPPWWRTWWAYSLYVIGFVWGSLGVRWLIRNWKIIIASRKAQYVSHYKLLEPLGEGGMGKVHKALDINTKQIVALKVLNPALLKDAENRKRLMNEGQLLSSFSHPHIVKVYEVSEAEDHGYIAMEFLAGGTLKQYMEKSFPVSSGEMRKFLCQICDGLTEIHSRGIIHRDVKTGNIMLDEQGNVRIMDFGLSKSPLVTTMTTLGTVIGTLGYVAPEQVTGMNVDHRVDIFSFGVILYELLTNQLPFKGENEIAVIHSIFNTIPPNPSTLQSNISPEMDCIVAKCLAKNPEDRFSSVEEVRIALEKEFC